RHLGAIDRAAAMQCCESACTEMHRVVISSIESSLFSVRSASLFTVLSCRFFRCIYLHTPGIRPLCAYKYSQVFELPAQLKHQTSLYTQCLEVGLAGRITMVLGKEKGEERETP